MKYIEHGSLKYRIKQTDINGDAHYSVIRTVRNENQQAVANIYVSSKQTITVDLNSEVKDNVNVLVVNMSGQIVARQHFTQASYRLTINMVNAMPGVYGVRVSDGQGWSEVKKILL